MQLLCIAWLLYLSVVASHPLSPDLVGSTSALQKLGILANIRSIFSSLGLGQSTFRTDSSSADESFLHSLSGGSAGVLRSHYERDIVLRFNISNTQEAESLAEAADTLFLDIWDSAPEYADIRLAKDVVRSTSETHQ